MRLSRPLAYLEGPRAALATESVVRVGRDDVMLSSRSALCCWLCVFGWLFGTIERRSREKAKPQASTERAVERSRARPEHRTSARARAAYSTPVRLVA